MKILSHSSIIMFLFDFFVLLVATSAWYILLHSTIFYGLPVLLIVLMGLAILFWKTNYRIRTFNNTAKNKSLKEGGYAKNQKQNDMIIPWCKFVNKARFDEIPQMIYSLKGEMSIVNPKTEKDEIVNIYKEQIPYYSYKMWINQWHYVNKDNVTGKFNIFREIDIIIKSVFLVLGEKHG